MWENISHLKRDLLLRLWRGYSNGNSTWEGTFYAYFGAAWEPLLFGGGPSTPFLAQLENLSCFGGGPFTPFFFWRRFWTHIIGVSERMLFWTGRNIVRFSVELRTTVHTRQERDGITLSNHRMKVPSTWKTAELELDIWENKLKKKSDWKVKSFRTQSRDSHR